MKKKFLSAIMIVLLLGLCVMNNKAVFAKSDSNKYYSLEVPDRFSPYYDWSFDTLEIRSYNEEQWNFDTTIYYSAYKYNDLKPYTQADLNKYVEDVKSWSTAITVRSASMVELNGVKGFQVTYTAQYSAGGKEFGTIVYKLRSDNLECELEIESSKDFIYSAEAKKIINSFKIKDTVLKSRGIPFTDVATNQWYYNAVKYVYDRNMISGYNSYTFAPDDKLTRGQLVTILYRMEGQPAVSGKTKFTDVQDSKQYYYNAVKWATDKKIISGYSSTKFGPNDNITREQLAVILNSYAKYKNKDYTSTGSLSGFKDANKVSSYALQQVKWAVGKGVITGYGDKTIKPQGNATRAEVAAMLQKYCMYVEK